jgi:hypothetical protein
LSTFEDPAEALDSTTTGALEGTEYEGAGEKEITGFL